MRPLALLVLVLTACAWTSDGLPLTLTSRLEHIVHNLRHAPRPEAFAVLPQVFDSTDQAAVLRTVDVAVAAAHTCGLRPDSEGLSSGGAGEGRQVRCKALHLVGGSPLAVVMAKTVLYSLGARCGEVDAVGPGASSYQAALRAPTNATRVITYEDLPAGAFHARQSFPAPANSTAPGFPCETVMLVLGNEALDDGIPTEDHVQRTLKAVQHARRPSQHVCIVATGGKTDAGLMSEAEMTQVIALARGVPNDHVILENRATNTVQNSQFSAAIVGRLEPKAVYLISKESHLQWALPLFRKQKVFASAEPMPSPYNVPRQLQQMEQCVALCSPSRQDRIRARIKWLQQNVVGPDMM